MQRTIIIGKNHTIPRAAFTGALIPSGMKPDAVAATVSRHQTAKALHTVKRSECSVSPAAPPVSQLPLGTFLDTVQDVVTVIAGLIVFGGLAYFCLVLA